MERFGDRVPLGHRKVLGCITRCRTGELGRCAVSVRLLRQRSLGRPQLWQPPLPELPKNKTSDWLAKQTDRLLPVHHFLVTFTVPEELRSLLRSNQREGYAAIFACGSETIRDVGSATRSLKGCELGFFGVLHTWGRDPTVYHPHVHFVVPGGGVNKKLDRWQQTAENFLFDHGTACRVYKAKFADHLRELGLYDQVDASVWKKKWIVDIRAVGDGRSVLKYLAPYVHRVAISDNRIVSVDEKTVTFR
nr:transposase [Rubripirellula obstinata]